MNLSNKEKGRVALLCVMMILVVYFAYVVLFKQETGEADADPSGFDLPLSGREQPLNDPPLNDPGTNSNRQVVIGEAPDKTGVPELSEDTRKLRARMIQYRTLAIEAKIAEMEQKANPAPGAKTSLAPANVPQTVSVAEPLIRPGVQTEPQLPANYEDINVQFREDLAMAQSLANHYAIDLFYFRVTADDISALVTVNGKRYEAWDGRVIIPDAVKVNRVTQQGVELTVNGQRETLRPGTILASGGDEADGGASDAGELQNRQTTLPQAAPAPAPPEPAPNPTVE